ncbi:MAG: SpoIID/LytB domain-containing protein [FCB group bacterium]|nr:SpoIID/LytB domain-containing protein [FCB group bacterium]
MICYVPFLQAQVPDVRVLILYTRDRIELVSDSRINIANQDNKREQMRGKNTIFIEKTGDELILTSDGQKELLRGTVLSITNNDKNKPIEIKQVPYGIGWWWEGEEDRSYLGDFTFHINTEGLIDVVNRLDMETYLYGVVPSEIGVASPPEALKAQAVCARSEAMIGLETGKYAGAYYDLTSDVMCQVYSGTGKANDAVRNAVDATKGEVLTYGDTIISAYYASNCGGHTESIENVWPDRSGHKVYWSGKRDMDMPCLLDLTQADDIRTWIEDVPDAWCKPGSGTPEWSRENYRWKRSFAPDVLSAVLAEGYKDVGRVYDIIPLERGVSGRIYDVLFVGENGYCRVQGELNIRRLWDPPLKSSCFVVDKIGPLSEPVSFILSGAGWGHGVGMCQTGAIAMAGAGRKYTDILSHYFQDTHIQRKYK